MQSTLTRESASKIRLSVTASSDEVAPAIDRAVKALGSQVKIPGFRKGHVPRKVLETRLGADALREATLQEAIPELVAKAVEEHTLAPIVPPRVEVTDYSLGSDLVFDAEVEVRPEIELPDFTTLSVTRADTTPTPEEVDDQLGRIRDRFASLEAIERPAITGDYVFGDFHTSVHGEEDAGMSGSDQMYEVGSAWPVDELDENLIGKKAGDIVDFTATLPEGGPHGGEEASFRVLVKEIRHKDLPALDDEFAKTASEFDTLDELKADIASRIEKVKAVQADSDVRNRVLEQVLDDVEVEVPESLVISEMAFRLERFEEQLRAAGVTIEQYMETQGFTEEQVEQDLRRQAERNVRAQLILEEVGRREGFQVAEDELRDEVRYHAETLRMDPATLAKQLQDRGRLLSLAGDIIRRKALNLLVEKADIQQEGSAAASDTGGTDTGATDGGGTSDTTEAVDPADPTEAVAAGDDQAANETSRES